MNWNSHMSSGEWIFSILATVIVLSLVIAAGLWIAHELRNRRNAAGGPSALEILDRRLASGELKADQYDELRRTLARPVRARA